ncbi:MAG: ABC transporter ATP-binding protein [bacterium]|nr:ABC transporter ATP-binding protein [bacterium]
MHNSGAKGVTEIPATPFAFIWFALKPYKKRFFWAVALVTIVQILGGLQAYSLKRFVDLAQSYANGNGPSLQIVFMWLVAFPVLSLLFSLGYRASGFVMNGVNIYSRARALKSLFEYLSLHSIGYFNDRFSGALSEKANTVSSNIPRLLSQFVWSILDLFVSFLVTTFIFYHSSRLMAAVFACFFILLIPLNLFLTKKQKLLSEKQAEISAKVRGEVIDSVTNISAVQQFSRRIFEITRIDSVLKLWKEAVQKSQDYREWVLTINAVLIGLFIGGILAGSFVLWSRSAITIGSLIMIATLIQRFSYSLTFIGQNLNQVMESYGEMRNGLNEIIRPHDIVDKPNARRLIVSDGIVAFDNATFAYDKDPRLVFKDLSFEVKGGEKVGVVGTSGAGKTTLMKLLLRQHDLLGGTIYIDGQDIRDVTQESLRENVSIVPQEPMLFHRTIRENIMYGKLDASDYEMIEVAKKAQAHDFIEQLPQKYDSLVGERGVKLSVGQRQRIAIARAFLKNAPILILDEATSALDSESEVAVQKALQALMEDKTVFAIAHRLSTLREMDRILVFKDGRVVEDGTHRTLLKNKEGVYASFWAHQAGGFIKEV